MTRPYFIVGILVTLLSGLVPGLPAHAFDFNPNFIISDAEMTDSDAMSEDEVLKRLSQVLKGWGEYFRTGNATLKFCAIDRYVWKRLAILEHRRRGWNQGRYRWKFDYTWYSNLPLYRLPGTIRYPGVANAG
jgi:hypothetical protein